ncbi:hypothetical protein ACFCYM_07385 [Streptomyces sp. NPDC056254]|uniref:hypothetical protein n=1 Tax=Streptomyces sp. NPDC056254 TaxID=3345763 RepID=UPI0035DB025A
MLLLQNLLPKFEGHTIGLRWPGRKLEVLHTRSAGSTPQAGGSFTVKKVTRLGDVAYAIGFMVKNIEFGQHPGQLRQARAAGPRG